MSNVNPTQLEKDLFTDISSGICYIQKLVESQEENSRYNLSKVKKYKPKTNILNIIHNIIDISSIKKDYEWHYDTEFVSDNTNIKILKYSINTSDWCIVLMDGIEKRITKIFLKELYERRDKIEI